MAEKARITKELIEKAGFPYSFDEENFIGHIENINEPNWGAAAASLYTSKLLEKALSEHAVALIKSAEASERHAKNLNLATWGLVGVTAAFVLVAFIQLIVTIK